jgi:hypothetical protein
MLQLLRGAGLVLALEEALVDEIRNVLHFVFAHPSRCAVRGRQFRHHSLRNNTGVLGNVVHVLGDAARRCRLSPGLALLDAKSLGKHGRPQILVLGPRHVGVFHRAKAHRPCALRIPALGERALALDLVVERAALDFRSEEGFLDVGHKVRVEVVLAYCLHDEDAFLGILIPLLG